MLVYHPAFDAYHCIFRALLITTTIQTLEIDKLRILDFFLCFPSELQHIRLPRNHSEARRIAKSLANDYHGPIGRYQTFRDMEHIQLTAYTTLAASRLFQPDEFERGLVRRTNTKLPEELYAQLEQASDANRAPYDFITIKLASIPILGENGLKHRTGLMEYRYDVT